MNIEWWPVVVALITGGVGMEITRGISGWITGREPEKRKKNQDKVRQYNNEHENRLQEREFSSELLHIMSSHGLPASLIPKVPIYRRESDDENS